MTLLTLSPQLRLPYAQDWNLAIERSFGNDWLLEAGYVGTKGTRLPRFIEGNPSLPKAGQTWADQQNNIDQQRVYCMPNAQGNCTYSSVGLVAGIANSPITRSRPACASASAAASLSSLPTPIRRLWICLVVQYHRLRLTTSCRRERLGAESSRPRRRIWAVDVRRAPQACAELYVGIAILETGAQLVPEGTGELAGERHHHAHERHSLHRRGPELQQRCA